MGPEDRTSAPVRAWRRLLGAARALGLLQRRCPYCLGPFTPATDMETLCPACAAALRPYTGPRCPCCGLPILEGAARLCAMCQSCPPPWDGVALHGLYLGPLRQALLRFKFHGHLYLQGLLAGFLRDAAACLPRPDALVPVPQHPTRLRRRGYNQAHELALALSRCSGLPLRAGLLARSMPGPSQAHLAAVARHGNVRHSFAARPEAGGLSFWLVDDIMTTGSTLAAATLALRAAGAARVDVLVVARTPRLDEQRR